METDISNIFNSEMDRKQVKVDILKNSEKQTKLIHCRYNVLLNTKRVKNKKFGPH